MSRKERKKRNRKKERGGGVTFVVQGRSPSITSYDGWSGDLKNEEIKEERRRREKGKEGLLTSLSPWYQR